MVREPGTTQSSPQTSRPPSAKPPTQEPPKVDIPKVPKVPDLPAVEPPGLDDNPAEDILKDTPVGSLID